MIAYTSYDTTFAPRKEQIDLHVFAAFFYWNSYKFVMLNWISFKVIWIFR